MNLELLVSEADAGARLDAVLAKAASLPRGRAADLINAGLVSVDGEVRPKSYRVVRGEVVRASGELAEPAVREPPAFGIVHSDDAIIVVEKPPRVVVHPAAGTRSGTLVDALVAAGVMLAPRGGADRPGIVHRLDRDVSGLLVVAKTDAAHEALTAAIAARHVRREYLAGVANVPDVDTGRIEAPVGRDPRHRTRMTVLAEGKPSVTMFRVKERFPAASLLEVRLETGRTHQIRTHLASIGHPVLGDAVYGRDPGFATSLGLTRPFLHAYRLGFDHPTTGERVTFRSDLPDDLRAALDALRAT